MIINVIAPYPSPMPNRSGVASVPPLNRERCLPYLTPRDLGEGRHR